MNESTNQTFPLDGVFAQLGFLEGKVLTIVDASYSDPIQRKAVKDLVRGSFTDQRNHIEGLASMPESPIQAVGRKGKTAQP